MDIQLCDQPFRVSLVGTRRPVDGKCYGEVGQALMKSMWDKVKQLGLKHHGINHWVYLPGDEMFTGLELKETADDLGELHALEVELPRYARYVHVGPYSKLHDTWEALFKQISDDGLTPMVPNLEVYGHYDEDPEKLETTILIKVDG